MQAKSTVLWCHLKRSSHQVQQELQHQNNGVQDATLTVLMFISKSNWLHSQLPEMRFPSAWKQQLVMEWLQVLFLWPRCWNWSNTTIFGCMFKTNRRKPTHQKKMKYHNQNLVTLLFLGRYTRQSKLLGDVAIELLAPGLKNTLLWWHLLWYCISINPWHSIEFTLALSKACNILLQEYNFAPVILSPPHTPVVLLQYKPYGART